MILEQIKGPEELKQLSSRELAILAEEIRTFLIEKIRPAIEQGLFMWLGVCVLIGFLMHVFLN